MGLPNPPIIPYVHVTLIPVPVLSTVIVTPLAIVGIIHQAVGNQGCRYAPVSD